MQSTVLFHDLKIRFEEEEWQIIAPVLKLAVSNILLGKECYKIFTHYV